MVDKILELTDIKTFWEDVKKIVGYYDNNIDLEDWQIKQLQAYADMRYADLLQKSKGV